MDLLKKREELAQEMQESIAQARSFAERAVFLKGAIALLNEQLAETAVPAEQVADPPPAEEPVA